MRLALEDEGYEISEANHAEATWFCVFEECRMRSVAARSLHASKTEPQCPAMKPSPSGT